MSKYRLNKYRLRVIVVSPENQQNKAAYELLFTFVYDPEQYGNGHYASIRGANFWHQVIDLRYDAEFDRNDKAAWVEKWARNYWSGENGAFMVKELDIQEETE